MKFYLSYTAVVLSLLAGCMQPDRPGAAQYLPESNICYSTADYSQFVRNLNTAADQLQLSIMQSDLPEQQKQERLILLAAVRLAAIHCGLNETLSAGMSSSRLDGESSLFHTVRVLASASGDPGILWKCLAAEKLDIRKILSQLPSDTEFAVASGLDATYAQPQLRETLRILFPGQDHSGIKKWTESLSGVWILSGRTGECDVFFELRIPDRNGTVSTWLQSQFPFQEDGILQKPQGQKRVPFSVRLLPGEILLTAGEQPPLPDGSLLQDPAVQKRLLLLPSKGAGLVYFSHRAGQRLFLKNNSFDGMRISPEMLGVLTAEPKALILNSISDWDPVSEKILIPQAFQNPIEPLTDLLQIGLKIQKSTVSRQESASCASRMLAIKKALFSYAGKNSGKFPEKNDVEGLRELLKTGLLKTEDLTCPAATGDSPAADAGSFSPDNCSYIYVGGSTVKTPADFPLVMDWPLNHRDHFQVLTAGGEIRTIQAQKLDSCRKMVSILQSYHLYPEKDFRRLLEVADKLDSIFLKGHSK